MLSTNGEDQRSAALSEEGNHTTIDFPNSADADTDADGATPAQIVVDDDSEDMLHPNPRQAATAESERHAGPPLLALQRHVSLSEDEDEAESLGDYCDSEDESVSTGYDSYDSEVELLPLDSVLSQDDLQRHASVIAIGIPAPPAGAAEEAKEEAKEEHEIVEEVTQQSVTEAVALDIAEHEYNVKHKHRETGSHHKMVRRLSDDEVLKKKCKEDGSLTRKALTDDEVKRRTSLGSLEQQIARKQLAESQRSSDLCLMAPYPSEAELLPNESNVYGTQVRRNLLQDDDDEELEAQAGIPVILPGAFAMEGIDFEQDRQQTGYDSGFDEDDDGGDDDDDDNETSSNVPSPAADEESPQQTVELLGELPPASQRMLLDGIALAEDELPPTEVKVPMKIRLVQAAVLLGMLAAIGVIVGAAVFFTSSRNSSNASGGEHLVEWKQVGESCRGTQTDKDGSYVGSAVSLSANGMRFVVNSPGWDSSPSSLNVGQALVYEDQDGTWQPIGELIGPGPKTSTTGSLSLAQSVALSRDGGRIAYGSPDWNGGQVSILQHEQGALWNVVGQNLTGAVGENGRFGYSVALSSDGRIVAAGSPYADNANGQRAIGVVRVFQEQSNATWKQMGQDFVGGGDFELYGWSLAMSSDGLRVAVGSPGSGIVGAFTGAVQVFEFNGTEWTPVGQALVGDSVQDKFGHSLSLSEDAAALAVGGWEKSGASNTIYVGHVRVYRYSREDNDWKQMGNDLVGTESYDNFGYSVSLSASGAVVAIGSPRSNSFPSGIPPRGAISVFEFDGSEWQKQEGVIGGSEDFDNLGHSVAISGDAGRVAGGAPFAGYDGKYNNVGKAGVYEPIS